MWGISYWALLFMLYRFIGIVLHGCFLQLVFLSFCRGRLGGKQKVNRTVHSDEVKLLPAMLESSDITWVRRELKKSYKVKEWMSHPFPGVRVPTNCNVMYSTLPDSKSVFSLLVIVTSQCFIIVWGRYNSPRCLSWAIKLTMTKQSCRLDGFCMG